MTETLTMYKTPTERGELLNEIDDLRAALDIQEQRTCLYLTMLRDIRQNLSLQDPSLLIGVDQILGRRLITQIRAIGTA